MKLRRFVAALFVAAAVAAGIAGVAGDPGMTHDQPQATGDMTHD